MSGLSNVANEQYSSNYQVIGSGQTNVTLAGGAGGDKGDFISGLLIVPTSVSPGAVTISDGGGPAISVFAGGASSLSNLVSFLVPLGIRSTAGAWTITTGSGVSVLATGGFT